jgi:hypothetical protein
MFTNGTKQWFALGRIAAIAMAPLSGACSGDSDPAGPSSPAPTTTAIRITNQSTRAAWYLYWRPCGAEDFGEDRLGSGNVLSSNESFAAALDPGCYDVLTITDPGEAPYYQALWHDQTVSAGQETSLAITDGSWETVAQVSVGSIDLNSSK